MGTYYEGLVEGYRDSSNLVKEVAKNLPKELDFMQPCFKLLSDGLWDKANKVLECLYEDESK